MTHDQPRRRWAAALTLAIAAAFASTDVPRAAAPSIAMQLVASGLPGLVDIQQAGDGTGRLFLVLQSGKIVIYSNGNVSATPFLDVSSLVTAGGEQGLLGLAFHPQYSTNGVFFVHYTSPLHVEPAAVGRSVIARYRVSEGNPNVADPTGQVLLTQDQPYTNHKGGQIRFGPDGYLYIAFGDGGNGGDPQNNGQSLTTMLGKILRIDVNNIASTTYSIPPDNPFAGGARPEIWAYGLRNPWRFSFDRTTGDLFIGDVGQGAYEEVNRQAAGAAGGANYGWRKMEGLHCYETMPSCAFGTLPIIEYAHAFGCSVTGGIPYRGSALPSLVGAYVFSDYCSGIVWAATPDAGGVWRATSLLDTPQNIAAFGEDAAGELYVADVAQGRLYRIVSSASVVPVLSVSMSGTGAGRVSGSPLSVDCGSICGAVLATGTTVTLTATPSVGSTFVGWSGDADCTDGIVTLSSDRECTALFGPGFTDDTLAAGVTTIKAVHVTELRTRVNAVRARFGLAAFAWSDASIAAGATLIRAPYIVELRTALTQAYAAAGRSVPTFTDASLAAGAAIRAVHISELRSAVLALET